MVSGFKDKFATCTWSITPYCVEYDGIWFSGFEEKFLAGCRDAVHIGNTYYCLRFFIFEEYENFPIFGDSKSDGNLRADGVVFDYSKNRII
jgi:hypothetical protein